MNEVVETFVKQYLWFRVHDQAGSNKHLEHAFVKVEIDSSRCLIRCARPIKVSIVFFPPDGKPHLKRPIAGTIIINKIFERLRLCGKIVDNQLFHGLMGTRQ